MIKAGGALSGGTVRILVAAAAAVGLILAAAGPAAAGCDEFLWPVDTEKAAFARPDLPALDTGATQGAWAAGTAFTLKLKPQQDVKLAVAPTGGMSKVKKPFAGIVTFKAPSEAGLYHVTMSAPAWIEVIQDGAPLPAMAFSGAHECPGVRKSVRFEIKSAPVVLQLSGSPAESIKIAIVPARD
jgi:hypothetical protein